MKEKSNNKDKAKGASTCLNCQCHLSLSWTEKETSMLEACLLVLLCWQTGRQVPVVQSGWTYLTDKQKDLEERTK